MNFSISFDTTEKSNQDILCREIHMDIWKGKGPLYITACVSVILSWSLAFMGKLAYGASKVVADNLPITLQHMSVPRETVRKVRESHESHAGKVESGNETLQKGGKFLEVHTCSIRDFHLFFKSFFGRPGPGTLRIASKSSSVYKASCEKGLRPALFSRFLTLSLVNPKRLAISEIVIPSIVYSIGIIIFTIKSHLLNNCIVKIAKKIKKFHQKANLCIDLFSLKVKI